LILVVDDEAQIREVSRRILELHGYRVETAGDGMEAIAAFARQKDDVRVLITDTDMPRMDGKSLIRVLLRMRPDLGIVASGGRLSPEDRAAFQDLSVRRFLDKPYQPDNLLSVAHDVIHLSNGAS
jgi:CheY-like chemotaxis protein